MYNPVPVLAKPRLPELRHMVLLYNHADPDESFVTMLTEKEIEDMEEQSCEVSRELMAVARANAVRMPSLCYYA